MVWKTDSSRLSIILRKTRKILALWSASSALLLHFNCKIKNKVFTVKKLRPMALSKSPNAKSGLAACVW